MMLVLIGPHGVGKTTTGLRLARALGVPFHHELGREMAEDPSWRPQGATAADKAVSFDQELFTREVARDAAHPVVSRVVESWHPVNLAYASQRSPAVVKAWLKTLTQHCAHHPALVLQLTANRSVLAARQSEPGDLDFFMEVGAQAARWADLLGLSSLGCFDTSQQSPEVLVTTIVESLQRLSPSFPRSIPCA